jgi:uncharacterized protein (DUF736 family)
MNIGEFKSVDGRLMGAIATRTIDLPRIGLRPVESQNDRAPIYEVVVRNVGGRWVQIGALWEAVSNASGEAFLQGSLEDPSLSEPLPIALFGTDEEGYPNETHRKLGAADLWLTQQRNYDWFRFWLQDYEDPNPGKIEQYARWRGMRDAWQKAKAQPSPTK